MALDETIIPVLRANNKPMEYEKIAKKQMKISCLYVRRRLLHTDLSNKIKKNIILLLTTIK